MIDKSRVDAFVGRNADYYFDKWQAFEEKEERRADFNLAAFLFSAPWLVYRKLYREFFVLLLVFAVDSTITTLLESMSVVSPSAITVWDRISIFFYGAIVGTFGNYLYLRRFRQTDEKVAGLSDQQDEQLALLRESGGTTALGALTVVSAALLLLIIAPFFATPELIGSGHHNLLSAIRLPLPIAFGILFSLQSLRDSKAKWIKVPLLSLLYAFGLGVVLTLLTRPVQNYWYGWAVDLYGQQNPYARAVSEVEPGLYRQFRDGVIAQAKREKLELSQILSVASENSRQFVIPKAREHFMNASHASVLRIADSHLVLLSEVANQHAEACANNPLGIQFDALPSSPGLEEFKSDFLMTVVSAIKSGKDRDAAQLPSTSELNQVLGGFLGEHPEYAWILDTSGQANDGAQPAEKRTFCDARLEFIDYIRQQSAPVAATIFRRIY